MSNKEEFGCRCFNPFGCYCVSKPKKPRPNQRGYRKIITCSGQSYIGETKDVGYARRFHGKGKFEYKNGDYYEGGWENGKEHGKGKIVNKKTGNYYEGDWENGKEHGQGKYMYKNGDYYEGDWENGKEHGKGKIVFQDGNYYEGDWKEDEIKQTRKTKKIPLDNADNIFLQNINDLDEINKKTFTQQQTKKNKVYVDITKGEKLPQEDLNKKDHLKIMYGDHGNADRFLMHTICDLPDAKGRKSYYISNIACRGAFVDKKGNNLFDKIKKKIQGTDAIGFFSNVYGKYCVTYRNTIDNNNQIGSKRLPNNKEGVNVNNEHFNNNKDEYFHYYCIINEGNKQNIYKIPHKLCYWREVLIDDTNTSNTKKYPNKFMEALDNLKQGKSFKFTTKAQVDIGDKFVEQNTEITISGKIEKVEVITHDVRVPRIKVVQSKYQSESQSINNISSTYNNKNNNINNSNISYIDDKIKETNNANNKNSVDELDDDEDELDDNEIKALDENMKSVKVPFVGCANMNDSNIATVVNKHIANIKNNTITNLGNGKYLPNH